MSVTRKFGRLPRAFNQAVPAFASLRQMKAIRMPPLPAECHNAAGLPANLGMMLNGGEGALGDCTIAGLFHAIQVWTQDAQGKMWTEPDSCVLQAYEEGCGYRPGDPSTDGGGVEQNVLTWASTEGIPILTDAGQARSKLDAFVELDPRNPHDICTAIYECGLAYIGFEVPRNIPEDAGSFWSGATDLGAIEGGHCVIVTGWVGALTAPTFDVISWGDRFTMDWTFWQRYVDEAYALFSPLWVEASGKTPYGLDPATLSAIMQAIRA